MPIEYYEEDYDDGPSEPSKHGILDDPDSDTVCACFVRRGNVLLYWLDGMLSLLGESHISHFYYCRFVVAYHGFNRQSLGIRGK